MCLNIYNEDLICTTRVEHLVQDAMLYNDKPAHERIPSETFYGLSHNRWIYHLVGDALGVVLILLDTLASSSASEVAVGISGLGTTTLVIGRDNGGLCGSVSLGRAASSGFGSTDLLGCLGLVDGLSGLGSSRLGGDRLVGLGLLGRLSGLRLSGGLGGGLLDNRSGILGLLRLSGSSSGGGLLSGAGGLGLAGRGITLEGREAGVVVTLASTDVEESLGALDLLKGEVRVVGVLEPVESPVATVLEKLGEAITLASRGDTAVLGTAEGLAELRGAAVEDTDTTAGHHEIEVVVAKITSSVGRLDDHLLALDGTSSEGQTRKSQHVVKIYVRETDA